MQQITTLCDQHCMACKHDLIIDTGLVYQRLFTANIDLASHKVRTLLSEDLLHRLVAYLCSIWLCPRPSDSDHSQPMLPTGVLILRLELQAQYLTRLQNGAMTGCYLKEHSQGRGLGHGA